MDRNTHLQKYAKYILQKTETRSISQYTVNNMLEGTWSDVDSIDSLNYIHGLNDCQWLEEFGLKNCGTISFEIVQVPFSFF